MSDIPPRWYIIQSVIGTLIDELILVAIVLWILPYFDIHIPLWVLIVLVAGLAVIDYFRYRLGRITFFLPLRGHIEAMIGCEGVVTRSLDPVGHVKVQGVLWKAHCDEGHLEKGTPIVVQEVDGLKLRVAPQKPMH
jgi:membrane protein implicated in regulation of membrane protease activity